MLSDVGSGEKRGDAGHCNLAVKGGMTGEYCDTTMATKGLTSGLRAVATEI